MSQDVIVIGDSISPQTSLPPPPIQPSDGVEVSNFCTKINNSIIEPEECIIESIKAEPITTSAAVFPPPSSVNPLEPVPKLLRGVEGIDKLRRAIGKELVNGNSNEKCSNLPHLLSIAQNVLKPLPTISICSVATVSCRQNLDSVVTPPASAVLKPFLYVNKKSKKTIRFIVDIVSLDGDEWSKVSARNPRSLSLLAAGGGGFGQKSMLDHAKDYLQCAEQNPCFFKPPRVKFIFSSGIGTTLCGKLEALGIKVEGERIDDAVLAVHPRLKPYKDLLCESDSNSEGGKSGEDSVDGHLDGNYSGSTNGFGSDSGDEEGFKVKPNPPPLASTAPLIRNPSIDGIKKLNLDISALLAYTSNLTNGHTNVVFRSRVLSQQLECERMRPQRPILEVIFRGRELYCCETAFKEFTGILETVGGLEERHRALEFLHRVTVVPDQISERSKRLEIIGNIKLRSVTIFGTGDSIKAVTVTANSGFLRSAKSQGIEYPVFLHESRALTEEKENFNSMFAYYN